MFNNNMFMDNNCGCSSDCDFKPIVKECCCCRPRRKCINLCECTFTRKVIKKMPDNCCCCDKKKDFDSNNMCDNNWGNSCGFKDNSGWGNSFGFKDNCMGDNEDMFDSNNMGGNCWG